MSAKLSGALFALGDCVPDDLLSFTAKLIELPKQRELVEGIFDLCLSSEEGLTDMPSLMERLGIKRPTVLQRIERLKELDLIDVTPKQVYAGMRSVNLYCLKRPAAAPAPFALKPPSESSGEGIVAPNAALAQQAAFSFMGQVTDITVLDYYPDIHQNIAWKAERFTVLTLLAGLRVGKTGKELQLKRTRIFLGRAWMDLEVRAPEGKVIPSVIDLRVLIVLCTLVREHLIHSTNAGSPEKGFFVRMSSICQAMEMDEVGSNKRYLYEQLSRWKSSEFEIKNSMYGVIPATPWLFALKRAFNILVDLSVAEVIGSDGVTPEVIRVILHPALIEALKDRYQTLSVHQEILSERKPQPFMHQVYYWSRRVVKHELTPRVFQLDHLRREIRPQLTLNKFRSLMKQLVEDYRVDAESARYAAIPGYELRMGDRDEVSINAKSDDKILGEASPRALAAKRRG